ncbi:unnamed protein product [Boreogadus saida]
MKMSPKKCKNDETLFCGNTESAVGRTRDALGTMRRTEPPCPLVVTPRRTPKQNTSGNHVPTANNSAAYP